MSAPAVIGSSNVLPSRLIQIPTSGTSTPMYIGDLEGVTIHDHYESFNGTFMLEFSDDRVNWAPGVGFTLAGSTGDDVYRVKGQIFAPGSPGFGAGIVDFCRAEFVRVRTTAYQSGSGWIVLAGRWMEGRQLRQIIALPQSVSITPWKYIGHMEDVIIWENNLLNVSATYRFECSEDGVNLSAQNAAFTVGDTETAAWRDYQFVSGNGNGSTRALFVTNRAKFVRINMTAYTGGSGEIRWVGRPKRIRRGYYGRVTR